MQNQKGGLLGNIPTTALLGSAIYGQGMQGRDPFEALLLGGNFGGVLLLSPVRDDLRFFFSLNLINFDIDERLAARDNVRFSFTSSNDFFLSSFSCF